MKDAFGVERGDISKGWSDDHPKAKYQAVTLQRGSTTYSADTIHAYDKGKSLILRRPKYQLVGMPDKAGKGRKGDIVGVTRNMPATSALARDVHRGKKEHLGYKIKRQKGK